MLMCLEFLVFTGSMVFAQEIKAQCVMTDEQYVCNMQLFSLCFDGK